MPHTISPDVLESEIKRLHVDRRMHANAIGAIDAALEQINQTLQMVRQARAVASKDELDAAEIAAPSSAMTAESASGSVRPKTYRKFARTGEEAILDLVRERTTATTAEINRHWRAEGRRGLGNNAIGRLLKDGLLLREAVAGQRGSRYRLAEPSHSSASQTQESLSNPQRDTLKRVTFYPLDVEPAVYPTPPGEETGYPSHRDARL